MRLTGALRKVDELGRIVLPADIRKALDIQPQDSVEIYVERDCIVLQKFQPACVLCGSPVRLMAYRGKNICEACRADLGKFK